MTPTPLHTVRVPADVWDAARVRAQLEGVSVSSVIVGALRAYGSAGHDVDAGDGGDA